VARRTGDESDPLRCLHDRLVAGDRTVPEQIARELMQPLARYLRAKFPRTDDHLLQQATADAVLDYCEHPDRYNPELKKSLKQYIQMIAWRNAANLDRDERRQRRAHREAAEDAKKTVRLVADDPSAGKWMDDEVEAYLELLPDERDRAFMRLVASDVTDVVRLAETLGFGRRPQPEMEREVKKAKDRIRATLRRKGRKQWPRRSETN
jgi:hypothetical protein